MQTKFPGFYRLSDQELPGFWKSCTVAVDANVLLNLYRHGKEGRDALLSGLELHNDRLWLPYCAALEYQSNRIAEIADQRIALGRLRSEIRAYSGQLEKLVQKHFVGMRQKRIPIAMLKSEIDTAVDKCINLLDQQESEFLNVSEDDHIRNKLDQIFSGRVGLKHTQETVDTWDIEAAKRYEEKIPPGYLDLDSKKNHVRRYAGINYYRANGDFYIWEELIAYALTMPKGMRNLAFITDDQKEDWWEMIECEGQKTIGPRPELIEEYMERTEGGTLILCRSDTLLHFNNQFFGQEVQKAVVEEVSEIVGEEPLFDSQAVSSVSGKDFYAIAESAIRRWYLASINNSIEISQAFPFDMAFSVKGLRVGVEVVSGRVSGPHSPARRIEMLQKQFAFYSSSNKFDRLHIFIVSDSQESSSLLESKLSESLNNLGSISISFGQLEEFGNSFQFKELYFWP